MLARFSLVVLTLALALGCNNTPAGNDAASPGNDAGSGNDAGHDAAAPVDVGPLPDTGPMMCADGYAGCTAATAMDLTGMSGPIAITVTGMPPTTQYAYTPNCIRISAGTMVTITNSALHPLMPASCSPSDTPITGAAGVSSFTFANAGRYGYWCGNHGADTGTGMAGLIIVE